MTAVYATPVGRGSLAFHDDDGSIHGTRGAYVHGCRCEACTEAQRIYMRDRRAAARGPLATVDHDIGWMAAGACRDHPTLATSAWYPRPGRFSGNATVRAVNICETSCAVQARCEQYGRDHEEYGIWGGKRLVGKPISRR